MPHVGDGEIHAYLDGALDLFPSAEAERIRDHLRSCPDCARRLEEEKGLREGAEAILAGAGPEIGDPPPFEEIRARASAKGPRKARQGRRIPPTLLPWAASIVLALAVGWGARDTFRSTGTPDVASPSSLEGAGARAEDVERVATEVLDAVSAEPAAPVATAEVAVSTAGAVALDTDATPEDDFRAADERTGRDRDQAQNALAPMPSPVPGDDERAVAKALADASEQEASAQEMPTAPAEAQARRALAESPEAPHRFDEANEPMAQRVAGEGGERRGRGAMESSVVPAGLMVPGLQVESIDVDPTLGPVGGLRIVQRLPGGEPLELLFVNRSTAARERDVVAGAAFADGDQLSLPATPDGWSRIRVPRPGGWLIAQGAVSADSLAVLVTHVR